MSQSSKESSPGFTEKEENAASRNSSYNSPQIFEIVRHEGLEELKRPFGSLFWSGIAAGIALSLSVYCKAFIALEAGSLEQVKLLACFGYTVGFVIVVLGRLQLFTENTITVVLPLLGDFSKERLNQTLRLWAIVFGANMIGTFGSAFAAAGLDLFPSQQTEAFLEVSRHLIHYSFVDCLVLGIPSGFLIAVMVWLLPSAKSNAFWVVVFITYFIALGGMTHVIAGSTEYFLLALKGEMSWLRGIFGGILPTLLGNIIGGTGLFALIAYAQVREEVTSSDSSES